MLQQVDDQGRDGDGDSHASFARRRGRAKLDGEGMQQGRGRDVRLQNRRRGTTFNACLVLPVSLAMLRCKGRAVGTWLSQGRFSGSGWNSVVASSEGAKGERRKPMVSQSPMPPIISTVHRPAGETSS